MKTAALSLPQLYPEERVERQPNPVARITAGILAIGVPTLFTVAFSLLSAKFDYPDILRQPATDVLTRFHNHAAELEPLWWPMLEAATLFVPLAVLLPRVLSNKPNRLREQMTATVGVLAGLVQMLGLARWVFVVSFLAKTYTTTTDTTIKQAALLLFETLHRYLGMGIGEFFGYLFTALWTVGISVLLKPSRPIFAYIGFVLSAGIGSGLLESAGLTVAGAINAISYLLWSVWLVVLGILLLIPARRLNN